MPYATGIGLVSAPESKVRVGQVNRVSGAISGGVYSNWSQDTIVLIS